jgi:hypothetical protein
MEISEEDWKDAEATKSPPGIARSTPIMNAIQIAIND